MGTYITNEQGTGFVWFDKNKLGHVTFVVNLARKVLF